jgi:hypothetical protein
VTLGVVVALLAGCGYAPTKDGMAKASEALTALLPTLAEFRVTTFRR